ncbi:hypothetical protein U8C35_06410 [Sinorhizobium medicae]|uniref:hypothetical protein n=1 Tax=Sinorhizobium medicae TaxID=110321 RepID=UPI002AF6AA1F|nr:hypothetical protein [Sinorhizobium medicae]WQO60065.1 hypothetical protein U8C35_06410 [Sinorhizobium medicae]
MTEMLYVVTAEVLNREQDGQDPQDGSPLQKVYTSRETWTFPAATPIGDIMTAVGQLGGSVMNVSINEDRVTAQKVHEERMAAIKAKRSAEG